MVRVDRLARRRRANTRLLLALGVGFWAALVWRGPRAAHQGAGQCADLLRDWMDRQEMFHAATGRYSTLLREVSVRVDRDRDVLLVADPLGTSRKVFDGRRDASALDTILMSSRRAANAPASVIPAMVAGNARVGITGACPSCSITLVCLENTDADSDHSLWSISSADRVTERGEVIRTAEPWLEHDDEAPLQGAPAYAEFIR